MPLKEKDRKTIIRIAKEFDAGKVWLFGSALADGDYNDIDLAVEGVPDERFYEFGGRLMWELPKPVDIIDVSEHEDRMIASIVKRTGKLIYEKRKTRPGNAGRSPAGKTALR